MTSLIRKCVGMIIVGVVAAVATGGTGAGAKAELPNPVLVFIGQVSVEGGGKSFVRYRFEVDNFAAYPKELFAPSPNLPPCGTNSKAARTWVDIYEQSGKRLNRFCDLHSPADLNGIWFALELNELPPSWVYIELTDRQTGSKYKSNLAETTL